MSTRALGFFYRFIPSPDPESSATLLLLHGTGGNEDDLVDLGSALAPGANLLGVRGKVLENGAPRFFRRLAEGVFDLEDLAVRTEELARFIEEAVTAYSLDAERFVAVGYSNGANIAGSLLLRNPGVLSQAVLLRAMMPFVPDEAVDLAQTPVFLGAGRRDPIAPPDETERLASLLRASNADVTVAFQDTGHHLTRADVDAAKAWLKV